MRVLIYISMFLSVVLLTSMNSPKKDTILVLINTLDKESFSKFEVTEVDGVLFGTNVDDYVVGDGIYRIKGTSNNKYQNRNIVIK